MIDVKKDRPYRIPKGYIRWEKLSFILEAKIELYKHLIVNYTFDRMDATTQKTVMYAYLWYSQKAPIYCLSTDLLRDFQRTNIVTNKENRSKLFLDFTVPIPTFILLLPENAIKTPSSNSVFYVMVHIADQENRRNSHPPSISIKDKDIPTIHEGHRFKIDITFIDSEGTGWSAGTGISEEGIFDYNDKKSNGRQELLDKDRVFLNEIRSLAAQCCLALLYCPNLIEDSVNENEVQLQVPNTKGFAKKSNYKKNEYSLQPRWIGRKYERKSNLSGKKTYKHFKGERKSPIPHWRVKHKRRVGVGKGRKEIIVMDFETVFVNE